MILLLIGTLLMTPFLLLVVAGTILSRDFRMNVALAVVFLTFFVGVGVFIKGFLETF